MALGGEFRRLSGRMRGFFDVVYNKEELGACRQIPSLDRMGL
jgi:hypothetical protein